MMQRGAIWVAELIFHRAHPLYRVMYGCWKRVTDRHERRLMRDTVRPGMIVIDVGANIGVHTRLLSTLVGVNGVVHAIEPAPRNCERLRHAMKNARNVRVHQAAASDNAADLLLHLSRKSNADHRVFDSGDGRESIRIESIRLDDCIPTGQPVGFIKIDVQGHELQALRGTRRIVSESPAIRILMEFWPFGLRRAGIDPAELLQEIRVMGLAIDGIGGGPALPADLLQIDQNDPTRYCNLVLSRTTAQDIHHR